MPSSFRAVSEIPHKLKCEKLQETGSRFQTSAPVAVYPAITPVLFHATLPRTSKGLQAHGLC